jgi:hypothetical protein
MYSLRLGTLILILCYIIFNPGCVILKGDYPDGGPKDTVPPVLVSSSPSNGDTMFSGDSIKLVFDKDVTLRNIKNKLVILPLLEDDNNKGKEQNLYDCKVKGKTVIIKLNCPLKEKLTYTFNFQNAIADLTEENQVEDLSLTFSTGEQIDSDSVSGCVKDIMTNEPVSDMFVSLYNVSDNCGIFDSCPRYFTKTDKDGNFVLKHLNSAEYMIYASDRLRLKSNVNMDSIKAGLYEKPIMVSGSMENVDIGVQSLNFGVFKINRTYSDDKYFDVHFSNPVDNYTVTFDPPLPTDDKEFKLYHNLIDDNKVLRFYNTLDGLHPNDTLHINLNASDKFDNSLSEPCDILFVKKKATSKKMELKFNLEPQSGANIKAPIKLKLTLNKPVGSFNLEGVHFSFDSSDTSDATDSLNTIPIVAQEISLNDDRTEVTILKKDVKSLTDAVREGSLKAMKFHIPEDAFSTIDGDNLSALMREYTFNYQDNLGIIRGTITTTSPGFIIQLLDKDFNVIEEIKNKKNYEFSNLLPQEYRVRVLALDSEDGKWYRGDIKNKIPPGKVAIHPSVIKLLPKWEVNDINFDF